MHSLWFQSAPSPNAFHVTGAETVVSGSMVTYVVEAVLYDDSTDLTFNAFTPLSDPDSMSVCNVALKTKAGTVGSNLRCSVNHLLEERLNARTTDGSNYYGQLVAGKLLNISKQHIFIFNIAIILQY